MQLSWKYLYVMKKLHFLFLLSNYHAINNGNHNWTLQMYNFF